MSEPATTAAAPAKKKSKLPLLVACAVSIGGGAAFPMFVNVPALLGSPKDGDKTKAKPKAEGELKTVTIPFSDAAGTVVNLAEERATRYLKLKLALVVDADAEKEVTEKLAKKKPAMKSWLLIHLAGKTLKDVQGSVGASRVQREILERFEDILYPDGNGALKAVLFEEYVVQ